jgi:DNA protecting protein DprA
MNSISVPTRVLLTLSALKGVGPAALKKVAAIPSFWEWSLTEWAAAVPQIARAIDGQEETAWRTAQEWANEQEEAADKHRSRIISAVDSDYPRLLAATKDDPFLLYVKGRLAPDPEQSVAIVGTREPTSHGVLIAQRITQFFVEQRWSVVSGLALGCDSIAHQAALDAGGHTVAVMAHGLQMVAPSRHKKLAQDILEAGGALVSEYPFGRDAMGSQFVKRDRTQAGMAQGVVMVQSDLKGGSLHASRAALDYKRWLAVPYPTDKDRDNAEPKVQANLLIADGVDAQRANLLRCPLDALRLVEVVRSRDDYLKLIGQQSTADDSSAVDPFVRAGSSTSLHEEVQNAPTEPPALPEADMDSTSIVIDESTLAAPDEHVRPAADLLQQFPDVDLGLNRDRPAATEEQPPPVDPSPTGYQIPPELAPTEGGTAYYLQVSPEDLVNLKVVGIPLTETEAKEALQKNKANTELVATVSRLVYLQDKLDGLTKLCSKRASNDQRALRFQFQVEDVLTHMKRAADQLLHLEHHSPQKRPLPIFMRYGAATGQPELPLMGAASLPRDVPLIVVLDHLLDSLPRSLRVPGHKSIGHNSDTGSGITVHLGDLIFSFNNLVSSVLNQGSHTRPTTLKETTNAIK